MTRRAHLLARDVAGIALELRYNAGALAATASDRVDEREVLLSHVVWPSEAVLAASLAAAEELLYGRPQSGTLFALAVERGRTLDMKIRTTLELARTVACRKCGAMAGQKCRGVDGTERDSSHAERHELAVRCGARRLDLPSQPS